jgi:FkbM family methyltransferase
VNAGAAPGGDVPSPKKNNMTRSTLNTYFFLFRTFRNWLALVQNLRHGGYMSQGPAVDRLVLRNGFTIVHPPNRSGLVPVMLEMWHGNAYRIGDFYTPKPGDVVIDVGAHIGLFTLRILQTEPRCRVICVEPSPENFACLQHNVSLLGRNVDVQLHNAGIGGQFGKIKMLEIPTNRSFDARTTLADETDTAAVDVMPLSHLFHLAGTDRIALLKMDAEGGENGAFSTADQALMPRIERLVMEYHDNYIPGTLSLLQQRLAPTHDVTVFPDEGEQHGRLFAIRKDLARSAVEHSNQEQAVCG